VGLTLESRVTAGPERAEDPMGGAGVAEVFVAQLPDATLELVPGAGHAPSSRRWTGFESCPDVHSFTCARWVLPG
jgi:hypothetical protein